MENETTFQVTTYKSGRAFNFPKEKCEYLGIHGGDTIHLKIREGTRLIFEGRKTLKSGTEIYGSDLAQRLPRKATIEVSASDPIRAQETLKKVASEVQERDSGFESDSHIRRQVEIYAMHRAKEELKLRGYQNVQDTSKTESYDFTCEKNGTVYYVEVKGTRGTGDSVFLTKNEVEHAQKHSKVSIAIIVSNITLSEKTTGRIRFISSWSPQKLDLLPILYRWDVPNGISDERT